MQITEKLFWTDPYRREFVAKVVDQFPLDNNTALVLDRTCFYATSGGQPCDAGTIEGIPVIDVRLESQRIVHVLQSPVENTLVTGSIAWERRFDHMQQHSGQHILSAAFFRLFGAETSSFHLGTDYCSIELNQARLSEKQIVRAEDLANEIVVSAMPVNVLLVNAEEAKQYPLRKQSDLAEALRIIRIGDFDLSPCSGTHIQNTSEVGMICVTGFEKVSQFLKIFFLCGNRIRKTYHKDLGILKSISKMLTTSFELLPESIGKLQNQIKEMRREVTHLKEHQLVEEAARLDKTAEIQNDYRLIVQVYDRPYQEVRFLAQKLSECEGIAGVLVSSNERRAIFFKNRSLKLELKSIFQEFQSHTSAKGGGPPHFLEAGGFDVESRLQEQLRDLFSKSGE